MTWWWEVAKVTDPVVVGDAMTIERARAWIAADPDPGTKAELAALVAAVIAGDAAAAADLEERFAGRLTFGTAGLRAEMGAGPRRMNRLVVRGAAAGLARWLPAGARVVIGFDARHHSAEFAADTARVIAAAGGQPLLFRQVVPTPVLAFAIRHLGADAGVMCTASHNPARDNGYKVYLGDGAQIIPPVDAEIAAAIAEVAAAGPVPLAAVDDPMIEHLGDAVTAAYVDHVASRFGITSPAAHPLAVVYTPLHGVGAGVALDVFERCGVGPVTVVAAQAAPDPNFATLPFPNPEEPGVLDLAIATARAEAADLVIAHDPDADRFGAAVPNPHDASRWTILTGNEIGALLGEHLLGRSSGPGRLVVSTFVSSHLLARLAEHHGARHVEVLTGCKWVVRPAIEHPDQQFVFGFEEALGFVVDPDIRDKDGITAAVAFVDLVTELRAAGRTVHDELERLARRHGHHATRSWSARFDGPGGAARMREVLDRWRRDPPTQVGARAVLDVQDLRRGGALPPTDALVMILEEDIRLVVRPSGTEPKVKIYMETVLTVGAGPTGWEQAQIDGQVVAEQVQADVSRTLGLDG